MRRLLVAFTAGALAACTCGTHAKDRSYACTTTEECADGFTCVAGECVSEGAGGGSGGGSAGGGGGDDGGQVCMPGARFTCAITACEQECLPDGTAFGPCTPTSGPPLSSNREHCGACGNACSLAFGGALGCAGGQCACASSADCAPGKTCSQGGLCVDATDTCASVVCDAGTVCRAGSCAVSACDQGCAPGEVCELSTGLCRFIDPCRVAVDCDGGVCEGAPKPDGAPCLDSDPCTFGETCTGGVCSGTPYSCAGVTPSVCQASLYCAGDGGCAAVPVTDGTLCDDGNACTHTDGCKAGACTGTTYVCAANICAATSICDGDGGCITTPQNEGAACDDTNPCSLGDVCTNGTCGGMVYSCPAAGPCDMSVACAGDGGCVVIPKANGAACDDGQPCTQGETCNAGTCSGGTTTTTYRDNDGDGRGDLNISASTCPAPMGYVQAGGDCNDNDGDVYRFVQSLVRDVDGDGRATGMPSGQCVGDSVMVGGRSAYKDSSGNPTWLDATASLGTDCDDTNAALFEGLTDAVTDADHDGYYSGAAGMACVGATTTVNGRTYYASAGAPAIYLRVGTALGMGECDDANASIYRSVPTSLDADQDGYAVPASTAAHCVGASAMVSGRTYYANAMGMLTWLSDMPLGNDCNDANAAVSGPFPWYQDGDGDGTGGANTQVSCSMPAAGWVTVGGDCDDANGSIYRVITVGLVTDADRDGYRVMGAVTDTSECVGVSTTNGGRTYYRSASGADSWLTASQALGDDCNDGSAAVLGAPSWYADGDGDGFGAGAAVVQCTQPTATHVTNNSDCNDASSLVYRNIGSLYDDTDQDGYTDAAQGIATRCVGASTSVGGRTYYRSTTGAYTWTATSFGSDCSDTTASLFLTRSNLLNDDDRDGYPSPNDTDFSACSGAASTIGGRQYYAAASGYYLLKSDCIGRQGQNCPLIDCYDQNASARPGQLSYFTVSRGDGSFDYDCSGTVISSPTSGTYCSSTTSATFYTDALCSAGAATANQCNTPTAFVSGNATACGKVLSAGTTGFVLNVTCTSATRAGTTTVSCR